MAPPNTFVPPAAAQAADQMADTRRHKWVNSQLTRAAGTGSLPQLLEVIDRHLWEMNLVNVVTALHRAAKISSSSSIAVERLVHCPSFHRLRQSLESRIYSGMPDATDPRALSNIAWSFAKLGLRDERLLHGVEVLVLQNINDMKPVELSNTLWAYTKLSLASPKLRECVADRVFRRRHNEFDMQCLSTVAWSFATAGHPHPTLFSDIAQDLVASAHTLDPQQIGNTLWAYAKTSCADAALFKALAARATSGNILLTFTPQHLSNTVWAFATAGMQHQPLFRAVAAVVLNVRQQLLPQHVANLLWAYAKLQSSHLSPALFPSLLAVAEASLATYKPQEVSAIACAATKVTHPACSRFLGVAAECCAAQLQEWPLQALARMVEALATANAGAPAARAFLAIVEESTSRLRGSGFDPATHCGILRGICEASWRFPDDATLGWAASSMSDYLARHIPEVAPSDLTHIRFSLRRLSPRLRSRAMGGLHRALGYPQPSAQPPVASPMEQSILETGLGHGADDPFEPPASAWSGPGPWACSWSALAAQVDSVRGVDDPFEPPVLVWSPTTPLNQAAAPQTRAGCRISIADGLCWEK